MISLRAYEGLPTEVPLFSYHVFPLRSRVIYKGMEGTVVEAFADPAALHPTDSVPVIFDHETHRVYLIKTDDLERTSSTPFQTTAQS